MIDIRKALEPLRQTPDDDVVGRTPPDWDLQTHDGQRFYLELKVRTDTTDGWLEFMDGQQADMREAQSKGIARMTTESQGRRRRRGNKIVGLDPVREEVERLLVSKSSRSREDKRDDLKRYFDGIQEHLLVYVRAVPTDAELVDLSTLEASLEDQANALDAMEAADDRGEAFVEAESAYDTALNEYEAMVAPASWLHCEPESAAESLSADELAAVFEPSLPQDKGAVLLDSSWTYCRGAERVTLANAIAAVIVDLAALATEGQSRRRQEEIEAGKETPTSGRDDQPKRGRKATKPKKIATVAA